jgi:hypothetical protein
MMEDLAPAFPLPGRGDLILVLVTGGSRAAPELVMGARLEWCPVTDVRTGPMDLYPVTVRLPDGALGAYQQGEIRGWKPQPRRRWRRSWPRRR